VNKYRVVRQLWICNNCPDGCTLHLNDTDREAFIAGYKQYRVREEGSVVHGVPSIVLVDEPTYKRICESRNGIWVMRTVYANL